MPYIVVSDAPQCPAGKKWGVFTETAQGSGKPQGNPHGCFSSKAAATKQQRALYSTAPDTTGRSEAPDPPNLRDAAKGSTRRCGTCRMFDDTQQACWGYGLKPVRPDQLCDSYAPEPSKPNVRAGTPEETMATVDSAPLAANTIKWRRERAEALSEAQKRRCDARMSDTTLELREAGDDGNQSRTLVSYASLFDVPYSVGGGNMRYQEKIVAGAFKRSLNAHPDVVFRTEHNGPPLAATWNGTLRLLEDARGLRYEADLNPDDPDAQALIAKVKRGDYRESSFSFRCNDDQWSDDYTQRDLKACELDRGDVSVVTFGASKATGGHMTLRSEQAAADLQTAGPEALLEALREWRDFTLLGTEERAGKTLSGASMSVLQNILSLISAADDAVDSAQPLLADLMGVPNPDDDEDNEDDEDDDDGGGDVTSSEQLDHVGRSGSPWDQISTIAKEAGWEVRDGEDGVRFVVPKPEHEQRADPTPEDWDVSYALDRAKMALAAAHGAQLKDRDKDADPDDKAVMDKITAAMSIVDDAVTAQSKDGRREDDPMARDETDDGETRDASTFRVTLADGTVVELPGSAIARAEVPAETEEVDYWLRSQDDVPQEERVDLSDKGREKMAKEKTAMPDGSYPIPSVTFLKKAIQAFGRASDKVAVKAWIIKRAKALGATNLLPDGWMPKPSRAAEFEFETELRMMERRHGRR